ncbi:hypothetical protein QFZ81_003235 [Paenibacillus sp. V4I9]|uniref:hypothetical protein n=1 Tax=Paenibacillus sp. V4I9 TaxID=3042308 RepID=UPI0027897D17|nr:hypothetical protein [Paenibacillus sp. V4I9]MDQ0888147.1 hypothetical protein [Paenibacillus sp. V4I9]
MINAVNTTVEDYQLGTESEEVIWIKDRAFVVRPATNEDIERIGKGYFILDYPTTFEEDMKVAKDK